MSINDTETLGKVLRARRKELRLTQAQLAKRAGVGRRLIVWIEAGHERAELGKVFAIIRALELALEPTVGQNGGLASTSSTIISNASRTPA